MAVLILLFLAASTLMIPLALADHGHRGGLKGQLLPRGDHQGNEATGEAAAWLFGAANLPVVLCLLVRGGRRLKSGSPTFQEGLSRFNRVQKKGLMWMHYLLNPVAAAVAATHFLLSRCRETALPEIGLMVVMAVVVTGLVLKFKWSSGGVRRVTFKVHTNPLLLASLAVILVIGHTLMD